MVRAMLKDASLPKSFWSDALTCAAYLRNRLPATFLDGKTPIEAISGRQPNMAYIRRFGQHCYIVHPSGRKPDDRGSKCILLGFASLGYKVLELSTRRVTFSRHCAFVDDFGVSSHSVDLSSFDTVFAPDSSGPIPVNDNGSSTSISLDDVDTVDVANPPPVSLQQEGEMPTTPVSDGGTSQVDPLQSSSTDSSRDEPAINETEVNFDGNEHANGETEDTIGDETPVSSDPIQPADPGFQPDQYYGPLDEDLVERITKLALRLMNLVIIGPPVQIVCQTSSSPLEMSLDERVIVSTKQVANAAGTDISILPVIFERPDAPTSTPQDAFVSGTKPHRNKAVRTKTSLNTTLDELAALD
ncbi:hypothetical protein AeRB84_009157, partial [Aphanomyces euteiches]